MPYLSICYTHTKNTVCCSWHLQPAFPLKERNINNTHHTIHITSQQTTHH